MPTATRTREAELAARWAAGAWREATLHDERGEAFRMLFQGRRGGGAGPDFRDAVLLRSDGTLLCGDIVLHLHPTGWRAHGHAGDPRYNGLALHVVLTRSARDPAETALASGRAVPLVVLGNTLPPCPVESPPWPCSRIALRTGTTALTPLLRAAGMARFDEHLAQVALALGKHRDAPVAANGWDAPNRVLWLALAEALGYGRDRAALRQLGQFLLDAPPEEAEALVYDALPGVERMRARGLLAWHRRWRAAGPWTVIAPVLRTGDTRAAMRALQATLRVAERGAVSPGRAAIVAVNVVLPFAAALAAIDQDRVLAERARHLYAAWPGLPSNAIVREMARTLGLTRLPRGALAQQGLHYLWQDACRQKRCDRCPCTQANPAIA
jgi:Protein of unknown function (DUF2851)